MKHAIYGLLLLCAVTLSAQTTSNVVAEQVGKKVVVTYDLDKQADISLCYSTDGGKTYSQPLKQVSGDVGRQVSAGQGKRITWDVLAERDKLVGSGIVFKVVPNSDALIRNATVEQVIIKEEKERQEAEQRQREQKLREQQQAITTAQKMGASFGQSDSMEGANGYGHPLGHGTSGGNNWSLKDRKLIGTLPLPENNFEQEGIVVVRVTVDKEGNVVQAVIGTGTSIQDETTRQLAIKAAKKAKFNTVDYPTDVIGTITYCFKFM